MIVRLKVRNSLTKLTAKALFQFYDSPIKSGTNLQWLQRRTTFQFYDSPIKSKHPTDTSPNLDIVSILW